VQYNKCDVSDPYTLEELHRKLETSGAAAFEATASQGTAVLPTLTTISKRVVRLLREVALAAAAAAPVIEPESEAPAPVADIPVDGPTSLMTSEPAALAPELEVNPDDTNPGDVIEAIAILDDHPDAELAALASASTEALFEPPAALLEGDFGEAEIDTTEFVSFGAEVTVAGALSVESIGTPERLGETAVRIPLVLQDTAGTRHPVSITVSFANPDREA